MASEFVQIQNTFAEPLKAYTEEGDVFNFKARGIDGSTKTVTAEEAEELCETYPQLAVVTAGGATLDRVQKVVFREVYVANMTGNPDSPPRVQGVNNQREFLENLDVYAAKAPRDIIVQGIGRRSTHELKDGIYLTHTEPGREERIEPYTRVKFKEIEARAFTALEMNIPAVQQGSIIESRPPAEWEPTYTMPHSALRLYLEMLPEGDAIGSNVYPPGKTVLGESEEEIRERLSDQPAKVVARAINDAKEDCWHRIVHRLFHPGIPLPTKKAYERFCENRGVKAEKPAKAEKAKPSSEVSDLLNNL